MKVRNKYLKEISSVRCTVGLNATSERHYLKLGVKSNQQNILGDARIGMHEDGMIEEYTVIRDETNEQTVSSNNGRDEESIMRFGRGASPRLVTTSNMATFTQHS